MHIRQMPSKQFPWQHMCNFTDEQKTFLERLEKESGNSISYILRNLVNKHYFFKIRELKKLRPSQL